MAAMLAARAVERGAATGSATLKALVLLENDPPGWAQQSEMQNAFGQSAHEHHHFGSFERISMQRLPTFAVSGAKCNCTAANAGNPVCVPALIVGGSKVSAKADAVGELFVPESTQHIRHSDGHRPLPKNEADCSRVVEQIAEFLLRHCSPPLSASLI